MVTDQENANPEGAQDSGELRSFDDAESFAQMLSESQANLKESQKKAESEPKPEESDEEKPEATSDSEEESNSEEKPKEDEDEEDEDKSVLSQIDLDELDGEQINQLVEYAVDRMSDKEKSAFAEKIGSGAGKDLSKLRKQNAELKEQVEKIKKSSQAIVPNDNPFKDISSEDDLSSKEKELKEAISQYGKILRKNSFEVDDDGNEGLNVGGKWYSREEIYDFNEDWHSQLLRIPERKMQLRENRQYEEKQKRAVKKIQESFDWYGNDDSPEYQAYQEMEGDPDIQLAMSAFPSLGAKLPEVLAYYAKGKSVKENKPSSVLEIRKSKEKTKSKPPMGSISGSGSKSPIQGNGPSKSSKFIESLFNGEISHKSF